jgi:glycerol-3-phosphate cytidylyltransferase
MIIGYTSGVFDLFHIGHLNILRNAKNNCDYLIVGITTDELAEKRKGKKPIIPFSERIEIVKNLKFVDMVVPQNTMNKKEIWENLKFNKMFVGDDWKGTPSWNNLEKEFNDINVEIVYFPYTTHTSSSILRDVLSKIK